MVPKFSCALIVAVIACFGVVQSAPAANETANGGISWLLKWPVQKTANITNAALEWKKGLLAGAVGGLNHTGQRLITAVGSLRNTGIDRVKNLSSGIHGTISNGVDFSKTLTSRIPISPVVAAIDLAGQGVVTVSGTVNAVLGLLLNGTRALLNTKDMLVREAISGATDAVGTIGNVSVGALQAGVDVGANAYGVAVDTGTGLARTGMGGVTLLFNSVNDLLKGFQNFTETIG